MKKISTVGARQIGKFQGQRLTIGLDLGDRSSWYCLLDEVGEVRMEEKTGQKIDLTIAVLPTRR